MELDVLEKEASVCNRCSLYKGRVTPVFAKGNNNAKVIICGMVPAGEENKVGIPFVGRAGKLLDKILLDTGWTLDDVYVTNLVKCYLAAGFPLKQNWIDNCLPYLINQIATIKPKVIITLGKDASVSLLSLNPNISLASIKGKLFDYLFDTKVIPTYHPSYLLRAGGVKHKNYGDVLNHFKMAKELLQ